MLTASPISGCFWMTSPICCMICLLNSRSSRTSKSFCKENTSILKLGTDHYWLILKKIHLNINSSNTDKGTTQKLTLVSKEVVSFFILATLKIKKDSCICFHIITKKRRIEHKFTSSFVSPLDFFADLSSLAYFEF